MLKNRFLFIVLLLTAFIQQVTAKETFMVPMRDGVSLATDVYKTSDSIARPVILFRTPYDKNNDDLVEGLLLLLNLRGYTFVSQDTRGRYHSEGEDSVYFNDGWGALQDGYDTIEWLIHQEWCNGQIGMIGASATGITTLRAAGSLHPNLKAGIAIVAPSDFYKEVVYPGGEYRKSLVENWIHGQQADYMIDYILSFPYYDENIWPGVNMHTRTDQITTPILHIGGWYDCFSDGTVALYNDLCRQQTAGPQKLVMGPWEHMTTTQHGDVGELSYPDGAYDILNEAFKWFDYWLKGMDTQVLEQPDVYYYLMGDPQKTDEQGCEWITTDVWPPPQSTPVAYYFNNDNSLTQNKQEYAEFSFSYDPQNPVPTIGGNNLTINAGPYDQQSVTIRDDVICFESDVLSTPVRLEGYVKGKIYFSSNRTDTDFTLKLVDVYPDGREMLVTDGIQRSRFRKGYFQEETELLTPYQLDSLTITLPPTAIVFNSGHKIKICLSSSNYPRFETNPNTGAEPNDRSEPITAENTIYTGGEYASYALLPLVNQETSVAQSEKTPQTFQLLQNYPNPFNGTTHISFYLNQPDYVTLTVYNSIGQHIKTIHQGTLNTGAYSFVWDAKNETEQMVSSGIYYYRISTHSGYRSGKMLYIK